MVQAERRCDAAAVRIGDIVPFCFLLADRADHIVCSNDFDARIVDEGEAGSAVAEEAVFFLEVDIAVCPFVLVESFAVAYGRLWRQV